MADAEQCRHLEFLNLKNDAAKFCKNCGIISFLENNKHLLSKKSNNSKVKIEIDPFSIFSNMCFQNKQIKITNKSYLTVRKERLKYLEKLVKKYKFSDKVFHLAVHYMDVIYSKDNCNSLKNSELFTIGSFLLSGKSLLIF